MNIVRCGRKKNFFCCSHSLSLKFHLPIFLGAEKVKRSHYAGNRFIIIVNMISVYEKSAHKKRKNVELMLVSAFY